jgi:hypothetical protein
LCRNDDEKTLLNLIKEKACIQKGNGRNKKRRATNRHCPTVYTNSRCTNLPNFKLAQKASRWTHSAAYWSSHIFQATDLHDEISGYIKMRGEE